MRWRQTKSRKSDERRVHQQDKLNRTCPAYLGPSWKQRCCGVRHPVSNTSCPSSHSESTLTRTLVRCVRNIGIMNNLTVHVKAHSLNSFPLFHHSTSASQHLSISEQNWRHWSSHPYWRVLWGGAGRYIVLTIRWTDSSLHGTSLHSSFIVHDGMTTSRRCFVIYQSQLHFDSLSTPVPSR